MTNRLRETARLSSERAGPKPSRHGESSHRDRGVEVETSRVCQSESLEERDELSSRDRPPGKVRAQSSKRQRATTRTQVR